MCATRTLASAIFLASLLGLPPAAALGQPVETELASVTAEMVELRQANGLLRLAVRFTNSGPKAADAPRYGVERITLVDVKSKRKYLPLKDATGQYLAGPIGDWIDGGRIALRLPLKQSNIVWAYFEPVAPGTVMNVELPYVFPFENVPVTETSSKLIGSSTAKSTPGGAIAAVVSAKRADQVLNVRLRLQAEPGATVSLGGSYFEYRDVFLFDPVGKRKYSMVKDADGNFQGLPLTVKSNGGSFILDWRRTTLVSLTFQAPPDSVTNIELLLPRFLPVEAIPIEGLGGAAPGGVSAAGRTLGLETALEALNAEVTPTAITIDLAADVLFDFDKASIKKEAEPSLQNLATVLKANPGAIVAIEGHTDAVGADAYNQTLSEQRAAAVKLWLVSNAQVSGAGISTRGWGESKPLTPNTGPGGADSPEGRARNRRVQVVVRKS
jgi:outer membrane protein OmpA-like peptidoglycan-associated protein